MNTTHTQECSAKFDAFPDYVLRILTMFHANELPIAARVCVCVRAHGTVGRRRGATQMCIRTSVNYATIIASM